MSNDKDPLSMMLRGDSFQVTALPNQGWAEGIHHASNTTGFVFRNRLCEPSA